MSKEIKEDSNTDDIDSLLDEIAADNKQPDDSSSHDEPDVRWKSDEPAQTDKKHSEKVHPEKKKIRLFDNDEEDDDDERHPETFRELFENIRNDTKDQWHDFYTQFQKDRKRRKEKKQLEFYGGKPPEDKSARSLYIGFYAIKKFLSIVATTIFSMLLIFIITGTIVGTVVTVYILSFMDTTTAITLKESKESFSSYIYSMNKETENYDLVYRVTPTDHDVRIRTDINKLPDYVKYAFVCTEDERFYSHEGVDYKRTAAAVANLALKYIKLSDTYFGGSTITQQLIKNVTQDDEDTWDRKMREIFSAMKLEKKYTKDEILESYLDTIYFDRVDSYNMYGIEAAAIGYYGKPAAELTIAEAATLSAIPQNPNKYNPTKDFEENKERKEYCLYKMFELGVISSDEYEEAMNQEIFLTTMPDFEDTHPDYVHLTESNDDFENPEIIPWDVDTAIKEFGSYLKEKNELDSIEDGIKMFNSGGYKLYLSTDQDVQTHLNESYADWSNFFTDTDENGEKVQSSCVVMDYKGHILGIAGQIGEKETNLGFNNAIDAHRQPGSTIKPVTTYGYAIENDKITWSSYYYDRALEAGVATNEEWPNNYDGKPSQGYYPVNYFLKRSINTLPAQIAFNNGLQPIFDFATQKLHLELDPTMDLDYSPLCVGGLHTGVTVVNLANAYMPYGNGGTYYKASIIAKAEDSKSGELIIDNDNRTGEPAVSDQTAYVMNKLLQKVINEGTGTAAQLSNTTVAGKTGTTENWHDITFVGLTPDYLSAIWVGYSNGDNSYAIEAQNSARIWTRVFGTYANEHATDAKFPECDKVIYARYCSQTGLLANPGCPGGDYGYYKSSNCAYCTSH
ncbi:MAG: transglycosylase domain-containing protein [Oscillospiraceae bacterium]|nr:transglycosylase domain-containing protein [Oscillospiraceae bacterium]